MDIALSNLTPTRATCDLLVLPVGPDFPDSIAKAVDARMKGALLDALAQRKFKATSDTPVLLQLVAAGGIRNVMVVPCGKNRAASWRRLCDLAIALAREVRAQTVAIPLSDTALIELVAESLELAAYTLHTLKTKRRPADLPRSVTLLHRATAAAAAGLHRGRLLAHATCLTRDLVHLPADVVTPRYLATQAQHIARSQRLRLRVLDQRGMRRLGMGALLGVARGSAEPPRFIELTYRPRRVARTIALVGKGITFDSGGLSLKNPESMQSQKRDMAGGAAVLGVMSAVRELGLSVEVRGYIPATENMPSGTAIKPGDVVRAYSGTTIEVLNTDAEGRLVLADALSFAARAKPDVMIDLATLTAAVRAALGSRYAAIMATDRTLATDLLAAAREAGENLWELPLVDDYRSDLDSSVADIKNTGEGQAGTIIGGLFLREFTAGIPWAHIDFSSTAVAEKAFPCHPRGATGFGVRTLLRYLLSLDSRRPQPH